MAKSRPVRGATFNDASARFNLPAREADGDWLDSLEAIDGAPPPLRTTVTVETPRTIISRNQSPDISFEQSVNPYRGCDHAYTVAVQELARLCAQNRFYFQRFSNFV